VAFSAGGDADVSPPDPAYPPAGAFGGFLGARSRGRAPFRAPHHRDPFAGRGFGFFALIQCEDQPPELYGIDGGRRKKPCSRPRVAFHATAATLAPSKGLRAASSNRLTSTADHLPPRAAGMPRSSRPAAMARSDSQPVACSS
jgi:hypothetical protein